MIRLQLRRTSPQMAFVLLAMIILEISVRAATDFKGREPEAVISEINLGVSEHTRDQSFATALYEALEDPNTDVKVKESAAWAIGMLDFQKGIPPLLQAAESKGLLVRSAAVNALVRLQATSAVPILIKIAKNDPTLIMREHAVLGLGLIGSEKGFQSVADISGDEREEVRGASCLSMAALHSATHNFSGLVADMKKDPSPYVIERAKFAEQYINGKTTEIRKAFKKEGQSPDLKLFSVLYLRKKGTSADLPILKAELETENLDDDLKVAIDRSIKSIEARAKKAKKAQKNIPKKSHTNHKPA